MQHEFLIAGFGGQGIMFAGQLLAYTAMDEQLQVTWIPSYGPEMRGGTAHCFVVVSDKPIGSPVVKAPKAGLVFNNPSFEKYAPTIATGGLLAVNASLITLRSARTDIKCLYIPATELADQIGNTRLANMIMLGAVLTLQPVLSLEAIKRSLEAHSHHHELYGLNCEALDKGAEFGKKELAAV